MDRFMPLSSDILTEYEIIAPMYQNIEHNEARSSRYVKISENNFDSLSSNNKDVQIICVGDMLCEKNLYLSHYQPTGFYFDDIFQFVRPIFQEADLVIGNLETMVCKTAPYTGEMYKINGKYHCNAPVEFLDAIQRAGIDFLMLANNHNCDCGVNGVLETLYHIDARNMMRTGLFSPTESKRYTLVNVKNITIAFLSYSTWYNRNETNFTERGRQQILNEYSSEKLRADIIAAKNNGAEFVLVYMHWGTDAEYKSYPSENMRRIAQEVANGGADYIIGSHTHSVQPYDVIITLDGRRVPCIYSMGNFVTSEINSISRENLIWRLCLCKENGKVIISKEDNISCYIPDKAYGISYPIIPNNLNLEDKNILNKCREAYRRTNNIIHNNIVEGKDFSLTKQNIYSVLGLECKKFCDEKYTFLNFAMDTRKDGVAIISDITSDPMYRTPEKRCEELADIAIAKGAKLLITTTQIKDYPCLIVEDVFKTYCEIIATLRKQFSPKTICITGSIGKSTTTELTYAVLSSKYTTHRNTGSANNVRYAGTVIQQLKAEHEIYVQETMEGPPYGAASTIAKMVQPQAAIITVVGTSHLEAFGSQERIKESCFGIQDGMSDDGLLILNGDDPYQQNVSNCKAVYYGIDNEKVDYRAINIRGEEDCLLFDVLNDGTVTPVRLHCFGRHNILNALAAFAAGKWAGMTNEEISSGLNKYRTSGIRQNLVRYGGQSLFLDCYNAAPESIQSALDAFSMIEVKSNGKRVAVLADIKEIGEKSIEYHKKVGKMVSDSCINVLFCYGEYSRYIAETVREQSLIPVYHTTNMDELIDSLKSKVTYNDIVLFKGSHSMALEHVVDQLYGTWFHEEYEEYDFKTKVISDENLQYRIYSDHATVINKISNIEDVVVPEYIEGFPITGIGRNVFNRSRYTHSIQLPNNLINIRYCAFYKADNIKMVTIPASVRIIDASAFSTCAGLEKVIIQPGCTHIGFRAFGNCHNLKSIDIPATVCQIDEEAFLNCSQVTIYGIKDSFAELYAASHNISFEIQAKESKKEFQNNKHTGFLKRFLRIFSR